MKAIRNFTRHIRNGFRNLFRNGWLTAAALLTMTVTLFMIGGLVLLLFNVDNITQDIEEGVQIRTYIDIAANEEDEAELEEAISKIQHVTDITYRSKEEELETLIETVGEEFELFDEDTNPLYNVLIVSVADPQYLEEVSNEIRQMTYAIEVNYGDIDTQNLINTLEISRIAFAFIAAVLVVVAVTLISNAIRTNIHARKNEIEIMRLVGAESSYIRAPFAIEGALIGFISGLIASGFLYGTYEGIQRATVEIVGVQVIRFTPTLPYLIYIAIGLLVTGIVLGIFGARRSIKKFLLI